MPVKQSLAAILSAAALAFSLVALSRTFSPAIGADAQRVPAVAVGPKSSQAGAFIFQDTATPCVGPNGTTYDHNQWQTIFEDRNGNPIAGFDCGGDGYSIGYANPFYQLGNPPNDVSIAGGYCLGGSGGSATGGYVCMSNDSTKSVAGVKCTRNLFFFNGVHSAMVLLGCFDGAGDFGLKGGIYALGGVHSSSKP
ncbi:MAG: hypothetical protein KGL39_09005 [Patescibacteria group bacterium]|nr:hypothetical protein [Patescibacteria group bacterium]